LSAPTPVAGLPGDVDAGLLALNNAHAIETSYLAPQAWARMVAGAFKATTCDPPHALLIAFDQDADYDSPNFLWFRARYARFVYVDRVIVSPRLRGQGVAQRLYADLFAAAEAAGHTRIVCEINADPPNPASDAFHASMGFAPLGTALLANGKTVRYLARPLP
jgi:uncharacterized protein